jgi:hypothetical protein
MSQAVTDSASLRSNESAKPWPRASISRKNVENFSPAEEFGMTF